jgi:drug/metabolite transporter (DMT)-like permease
MLLGAFSIALATGCWLKCLSVTRLAAAAPVWYLAVIFGVVWARWTNELSLNWWTIGGVALILLGMRGVASRNRRAELSVSDIIRG